MRFLAGLLCGAAIGFVATVSLWPPPTSRDLPKPTEDAETRSAGALLKPGDTDQLAAQASSDAIGPKPESERLAVAPADAMNRTRLAASDIKPVTLTSEPRVPAAEPDAPEVPISEQASAQLLDASIHFYASQPQRGAPEITAASLDQGLVYYAARGSGLEAGEHRYRFGVFDASGRAVFQGEAPITASLSGQWHAGFNYRFTPRDAPGLWWFVGEIDGRVLPSASLPVTAPDAGS